MWGTQSGCNRYVDDGRTWPVDVGFAAGAATHVPIVSARSQPHSGHPSTKAQLYRLPQQGVIETGSSP